MLTYFIGFITSMYLIYVVDRKVSYEERFSLLEALVLSALSWAAVVITIVYVLLQVKKSNLIVKLNDIWKR